MHLEYGRGDVLRAIQTALGAPAFGSDSQTLKVSRAMDIQLNSHLCIL